jgi:hypothetical protein
MGVATLYKARGMSVKRPVCAICVDRTRGLTQEVRLSHGVTVWLCRAHASHEFQRRRSGRDFVLTLHRLWQAHGCLTAPRRKALDAHLAALAPRPARSRPGSYAWPALRRRAEAEFAGGRPPLGVIVRLRAMHAGGPAAPPSTRTMLRWHHERRWLEAAATPSRPRSPSAGPGRSPPAPS